MDTNFEIYKGKSFRDLCKDIYSNQINRKNQIEILINDLRKMCTKIDDAPLIIPFIKDYINAANVNDEHLIRLAAIIQKLIIAEDQAKIAGNSMGLSEEERKSIMEELDSMSKSEESLVQIMDNK